MPRETEIERDITFFPKPVSRDGRRFFISSGFLGSLWGGSIDPLNGEVIVIHAQAEKNFIADMFQRLYAGSRQPSG